MWRYSKNFEKMSKKRIWKISRKSEKFLIEEKILIMSRKSKMPRFLKNVQKFKNFWMRKSKNYENFHETMKNSNKIK